MLMTNKKQRPANTGFALVGGQWFNDNGGAEPGTGSGEYARACDGISEGALI